MNRTEIELKMMGKSASAKYLKDNVDMNSTIVTMAKEASLNPHQVARVCEAANVTTYDELWAKHGSGEFTFNLADQEKIAEAMNSAPSLVLQELDSPISSIKELLPPIPEVETITGEATKEAFNKLAGEFVSLTKVTATELRKTINKLSHYKAMLDTAHQEAVATARGAEMELVDMLKTAHLLGDNIAGVYVAARASYPDKAEAVQAIFKKVATELSAKGISIKEAGKKYTEDALGNSSEAVVNKKHPILKHLDTVMRNDECVPQIEKTRDYVVSKIEFLTDALLTRKYEGGLDE